MPSSFSSAITMLPSSMPTRLRRSAGTTIAPRFPTLADRMADLPKVCMSENSKCPTFRQPLQMVARQRLLNYSSVASSQKLNRQIQPPLFLSNIGHLLTLRNSSQAPGPRPGPPLKQLGIIEEGAVLCLGGKIVSVGTTKDALRDPWLKRNRKRVLEIDCAGEVVLPGFVDSHTHPVFVSPRLVDFEKRIEGASYEEIAKAGGGIQSSVTGVREARKRILVEKILAALRAMAAHGTTTAEAKSGYGLTVECELKSLQAIRDAASHWPGTVVATLLGAHVVPKEFRGRSQKYVETVCKEMIPQATKRKLAQFVDVFCDRGAFTAAETEQIFEAAKQHGLSVRAHVGQLSETALRPFLRV